MDFEVPQPIQTALKKRIEHPIFGYTLPPENIGDIICNWTKTVQLGYSKEWIVFSAGIVPALSTSIQAFTKENESVLVQPPIYPHFSKWSQQITDNYA